MMDQDAFAPKISVIVPVYNCEAFVGRCLESILAQDYRNIEVIVIDDGSTDASTGICRAFAALDKRIVLLRQNNRGLSAARNAGLDRATGDYVAFVDGDDFINRDMMSQYVNCLGNSQNELFISGYRHLRNGKILGEYVPKHRVLEKEDALEELYRDETFRNFMCNKLYDQVLFNGIRFPEGKVYEDISVQYKLFEKSSGIMTCQFCGYNYIERSESISNKNTLVHCFDYIEAHLDRFDSVADRKPRLLRQLARGIVKSYIALIACGLSNVRQRNKSYARRQAVNEHLSRQMPVLKSYLGFRYLVIAIGVCGVTVTDLLITICYVGSKIGTKLRLLCCRIVRRLYKYV